MEERRASDRQLSCIPASFESKKYQEDLALIRDVSVRGARILTRTPLSVGDRVTLNLYFGKEAEGSHPAAGKIVRVERRDPPHSEVWHWELGVEFDEAITQYAAEIEALCRQQEAAGVLKR